MKDEDDNSIRELSSSFTELGERENGSLPPMCNQTQEKRRTHSSSGRVSGATGGELQELSLQVPTEDRSALREELSQMRDFRLGLIKKSENLLSAIRK